MRAQIFQSQLKDDQTLKEETLKKETPLTIVTRRGNFIKTYSRYVNAIHHYGTTRCFDNTEQGHGQTRFASPSSAHHTNLNKTIDPPLYVEVHTNQKYIFSLKNYRTVSSHLFTAIYSKADAFQNQRKPLTVTNAIHKKKTIKNTSKILA